MTPQEIAERNRKINNKSCYESGYNQGVIDANLSEELTNKPKKDTRGCLWCNPIPKRDRGCNGGG
jgi:hypothetical protein